MYWPTMLYHWRGVWDSDRLWRETESRRLESAAFLVLELVAGTMDKRHNGEPFTTERVRVVQNATIDDGCNATLAGGRVERPIGDAKRTVREFAQQEYSRQPTVVLVCVRFGNRVAVKLQRGPVETWNPHMGDGRVYGKRSGALLFGGPKSDLRATPILRRSDAEAFTTDIRPWLALPVDGMQSIHDCF